MVIAPSSVIATFNLKTLLYGTNNIEVDIDIIREIEIFIEKTDRF